MGVVLYFVMKLTAVRFCEYYAIVFVFALFYTNAIVGFRITSFFLLLYFNDSIATHLLTDI